MNLQSIININVDFYDKKYILINAKQLDKGSRFLLVTCYNHGTLFSLDSASQSVYNACFPSSWLGALPGTRFT